MPAVAAAAVAALCAGRGAQRLPLLLLPLLALLALLVPPQITADGCGNISACTDSKWEELALDPSTAVRTLRPGCWRVTPPADGLALKLGADFVLEGQNGGGEGDGLAWREPPMAGAGEHASTR